MPHGKHDHRHADMSTAKNIQFKFALEMLLVMRNRYPNITQHNAVKIIVEAGDNRSRHIPPSENF